MSDWYPDVATVVRVPTYYGNREPEPNSKELYRGGVHEFDAPQVPIMIYEAEGIRLILGSDLANVPPHEKSQLRFPDAQFERRAQGWAIFLHPVGGGDPCGTFYFHDDGRSWFVHECPLNVSTGTPRTKVVNRTPAAIDA